MGRPPKYTREDIDRMMDMRDEGSTYEEIAAAFGAKADSIRMILKRNAEAPGEQKPNKSRVPAYARATKEPEQKPNRKPNKTEHYSPVDAELVIPRVTPAMTIGEMADVLEKAKEGYERAADQEDESKRTWMETAYLKLMKDVLIQMGKWCGLDGTVREEARTEKVRRSDVDGMSLEDMMQIVRDL